MRRINLKEYYPHYAEDCYIEVPDELVELLRFFNSKEATYERKLRYHHACVSLDQHEGFEQDILYVSLSPEEIYERKVTREQLHDAMETLTDKQAKRIYAHFFLGLSKSDIARTEGIGREAVCESINQGLRKIERFLKKL